MTPANAGTNCHGCGDPLTKENDSEAHIIPNALGGRLRPKGIICRTCNGKLDRAADNALIEAFGHWPTLLDVPRQRGDNPPRSVDTRDGNLVKLERDGSLTRTNIQYDLSTVPEGQLVQRAAKQFPQINVQEAETHAQRISISPDDELHLSLDYSPPAVFGGVVSAIWLYLLLTTGRAFLDWQALLTCIDNAKKHGGPFRYYTDGLPGLQGPSIELGHKLVVRSIPSTGKLIAYVEILDVLKIGGIFAKSPAPALFLEHIYAYDLQAKADRSAEFSVDATTFEQQKWEAVGLQPSSADAPALRLHFKGALDGLERLYRQRFSNPSGGAATT